MSKKESKKQENKEPEKITKPSLFAANKVKALRRKLDITSENISKNTDIPFGTIEKMEYSGITDKYSLGQLNMIGKELYKKDPSLSMHDFVSPNPILSKTKTPKVLVEVDFSPGPQIAINHLLDAGFFKKEEINTEIIAEECERIFKKKFNPRSLRNTLNELVAIDVLKKHKVGKTVYYQEA